MSFKSLVWVGVTVGSLIGGFAPSLWGADMFSVWGVIGSGVGGLLGIWIAYKLSR